MLCEQFTGVAIMLICNQCSRGWHMGCFMLSWEEMLIKNVFAHSAHDSPTHVVRY
jgi:hypothetical protein